MSNINLYQSETGESKYSRSPLAVDSGLIISIIILIVTLGAFSVAKVLKNRYVAEEEGLKAAIKTEGDAFFVKNEGQEMLDIERVLDFYTRMNEAESNVLNKLDEVEMFSSIELWIIPKAKTKNISYTVGDGGTIATRMNIVVSDFTHLARQMFSFKESGRFQDVYASNIKKLFDAKGNEVGVEFLLDAKYIPPKKVAATESK